MIFSPKDKNRWHFCSNFSNVSCFPINENPLKDDVSLLLRINFSLKDKNGFFQIILNNLIQTKIFQRNLTWADKNSSRNLEFSMSLTSSGMAHPIKSMRFHQFSNIAGTSFLQQGWTTFPDDATWVRKLGRLNPIHTWPTDLFKVLSFIECTSLVGASVIN